MVIKIVPAYYKITLQIISLVSIISEHIVFPKLPILLFIYAIIVEVVTLWHYTNLSYELLKGSEKI